MTDAGGAGDDAATLLFAAIHAHNLPGVQALIAAEPGLLTTLDMPLTGAPAVVAGRRRED